MKKSSLYEGLDISLVKTIKLSIVEGSFSTVMGTLIGGTFLIGYALTLGADDFTIGLLASLPLLANLIQIAGSIIISKVGSKKKVCVVFLTLHRIMWTFIMLLPLFVFRNSLDELRIWIFIFLICISSVFASITGLSWTSWVADIIPTQIQGKFFAKRNIVAQIVGMLLAIAAGSFIDFWRERFDSFKYESYGFSILFAIGLIFGFLSIFMLKKMNESKEETLKISFFSSLKTPFLDKNYRNFIIFSSIWGFSTGLAGPFFSVYMIRTLLIPFSIITLFGVVAGTFSIIGMKFFSVLMDKIGTKLLYILCATGGSIIPLFWIFATSDNYIVLWISNMLAGFFFAGIGLSSTRMMMNLAPNKQNSIYFAVFASVTGLFGALAPIVGGLLGRIFDGVVLYNGFIYLADIRLLFLLSSIMMFLSVFLLSPIKLKEPMSLKDLLNSIGNLQNFFPLYNIQYFASSSINYAGNITASISRGIINLENKLDRLLKTSSLIGRKHSEDLTRLNNKIDKGLDSYESKLDGFIDQMIKWFNRKDD